MTTDRFTEELELNRRAYFQLQDRIRSDHAGKYVGMAFGRVVTTDVDYDKVVTFMDSLNPTPACSLVFAAEDDPLFDPPETLPDYEYQDSCDAQIGPSVPTVDTKSTSRSVH